MHQLGGNEKGFQVPLIEPKCQRLLVALAGFTQALDYIF
jgi:hypothetical protein